MLYLYVHEAEIKTTSGKSISFDPFCCVSVDNDQNVCTNVCQSSLEPKWHQSFEFKCRSNSFFSVVIYDHDTIGDLFVIANYTLNLSDIQSCVWYDEKLGGVSPCDKDIITELHISFSFIPGESLVFNKANSIDTLSCDETSGTQTIDERPTEILGQCKDMGINTYAVRPDVSLLNFQPLKCFASEGAKKKLKQYEKFVKKKIKERKRVEKKFVRGVKLNRRSISMIF